MRMWSRGLGKENLSINLNQIMIKTFDEGLVSMPDAAKERFSANSSGNKRRCLTVTGKIDPPVGWEFVILISIKDVFRILPKFITLKVWRLFL
jgi:hypothetical protein